MGNKYEYICVPTHVEQQDDGEIHIYGQTTDRSTMGRLTAKVGKGAGYAAIGSNYHRYDAGEIEINGGHIEVYETSMEELIIPPTNVCRENSIFSVGEDIFFDEEATVFVATGTNVDMQKDSIGVVGYNSETKKFTFNNTDVANHSTDSSKEFTGEFIVRKNSGGKFQFFPLYHDKKSLPDWDWNGHYSAKAELTGFAYYFSGWNDVDHTQTIDAQITYADTEPDSDYSEYERVYTATAVTPGVTFTDERRETLSPKCRNIEGVSYKLKDVAGSLYMYSRLADIFFGKIAPSDPEEPAEG